MSETVENKPTRKTSKTTRKPASKKGTIAETIKTVKATDPGIPEDRMIPTMSYIAGTLCHTGKRTKTAYMWAARGDVENMTYGDLKAELDSNRSKLVYTPFIIILDDEVYEKNERILDLYSHLYAHEEIERILCGSDVEAARIYLEGAPKSFYITLRTIISDLLEAKRLNNIYMREMIDEVLHTDFQNLSR